MTPFVIDSRSALALALAGVLSAQAPTQPPALADAVATAHHAAAMHTVDGVLCGLGPGYKARFDAAGMTFTPALGAAALRSHPLRVALAQIRRGEHVLFDARNTVGSGPRQVGTTAVYARCRSVTETCEARVDGVEQSFVFAERPPGHGDLVVRCRVETDLAPTEHEVGGALVLAAEGLGGVAIGEVVGIDAAGARVAGTRRLLGDELEFTLPAAFVERAAYPLVLDPLYGNTISIAGTGGRDPEVAFDAGTGNFLVVWEDVFSAVDSDITGRTFDAAGSSLVGPRPIATGTRPQINPAVAAVRSLQGFFVVYQEGNSLFGPWDVRGAFVPADPNLAVGAPILIAADPTINEITPDVGGETTATGSKAVVVWHEDGAGIFAVDVDVAARTVGNAASLTQASEERRPAISRAGGPLGRFLVTWEGRASTGWQVLSAYVDRDLQILQAFHQVTAFATGGRNPAVDGDGTDFLVAYDRPDPAASALGDVYCRRVSWNGTALVNATAEIGIATTANDDERTPAVGLLGAKYLIAWADALSSGGLRYEISAQEVDLQNCVPCGLRTHVSAPTGNTLQSPAIGTRYTAAAGTPVTADEGILAYTNAIAGPPFSTNIALLRARGFGAGSPPTDLGGACGNGGSNGFVGPVVIGNAGLRMSVAGAGSNALFASLQFVDSTTTCGACTYNNLNSYLFVPGSNGGGSRPLPIPCDSSFLGLRLRTQWAAFLSGVNPCSIIAAPIQVSFSNRLEATIDW
ncbi:MAG: hypothetical protein KDE27_02740 [Planctomycetes bacterium]|nr:hypothetical protein [Planctomycetota bacterium]